MPRLPLNKITNHLMFITLTLFAAACLFVFIAALIGRIQGNNPSPAIPWTTLQVGFILIIVPFIGKRIYSKVVNAPEDVTLPAAAGVFVGFLNGLLYGGALLIIAGAILFCLAPEKLFDKNIAHIALGVLVVTGGAGVCFPVQQVARKARLWLLLTLICQFVTISTMRQLLGLMPLKFDYRFTEVTQGNAPLVPQTLLKRLIPPGAKNIHLHGTTSLTEMRCEISEADVQKFIAENKYSCHAQNETETVFGDNEIFIWVFNHNRGILDGFFRRDGLPQALVKKTDEVPQNSQNTNK